MGIASMDFAVTADTGRRPSPNVWLGCPIEHAFKGPFFSDMLFDGDDFPYFMSTTANKYKTIVADSGASIALRSATTVNGGVIRLTTGGTDENEVYISAGSGTGPGVEIKAGYGDVWMECRVKVSQITDACWFAGLAVPGWAAANEITDATGALADHNYIGFRVLANDLTYLDAVYNTASGGGETVHYNQAQLVAVDTWYKLGVRYDDSQRKLFFFINGTVVDPAGVAVTATNFPDSNPLAWALGAKSVTGTTVLLDCDWWFTAHQIVMR